jgi:class 3 adenylate cyclase
MDAPMSMLEAMEHPSGLSGRGDPGHTPSRMPRASVTTELVTVLFTDIVSSTQIATEVGDKRWRALVAAHHGLVRQALKRYRGRELDTAGDGFFATFPRPADAIRCACEVAEGVRQFGLEIRAGLNLGEAEIMGGKVGGIVVNTGARIMAIGTAGEVLVSSTVRDAVAGKGIGFADHGVHQLKGIDGEHHVFVVATVDDEPVPGPLDPAEATRRRELPPQLPSSGSRLRIAAIAAAVLVLGAIAFAVTWGGGAEPEVGTHTDAHRELTEDDEALLRVVPDDVAESCTATPEVTSGAAASVTCDTGDITVRYDGFRTLEEIGHAFDVATAGASVRGTSCRDEAAATTHYEVGGQSRGSVACWVEKNLLSYTARIVWTDDTLDVLANASFEVTTDSGGSVPDLTLYEWWSENAGPTDAALVPKDDPIEGPLGTYRLTIRPDEVGPLNEGKVDPVFVGDTTLVLRDDAVSITWDDGTIDGELLWGKPHRLIVRIPGDLGTDYGRQQCPRLLSWTWEVHGDVLILSDPSDEPACNGIRTLLTHEPLERVG